MKMISNTVSILIISLVLFVVNRSATAGSAGNPNKDENLQGRLEYEYMMLHDPATGKIPNNIRALELEYAKSLPIAGQTPPGSKLETVKSTNWTSVGPYNIGGRTRALAVDVSNQNIILAGGVSGGMWRSTDGGQSWNKTTTPGQLQSVSCIAQDTRPGHTNVFYYGTGEYYGNSASGSAITSSYNGNGIFKSTDDGQSWFPLPSTEVNSPQVFVSNFQYIWNIATDSVDQSEDVVYAATFGAIEKSTDGGTTWTMILGDGRSGDFTDVNVASSGAVYATLSSDAGQYAGIWRSTSGNKGTFVNITPSGWPTVYRRIVLDSAPSDPNLVYFLAETPGGGLVQSVGSGGEAGCSLWIYTYGAASPWQDRSSNIPALGGQRGNFDPQNSYDLLIKVKPDDPNFVVIGGTNLYRSTDGFAIPIRQSDWIGGYNSYYNDTFKYPNQHSDEHAFVFMPSDPSAVISGNDGGVDETYDVTAPTVIWTSLNNGYLTTQFYSVAMDEESAGGSILIGGMQDNGSAFFNSSNTKAPWYKVYGGDGTFTAIANNKTFYYTGIQDGGLMRTQMDPQGNISWQVEVDPKGADNYLFVSPYALDPNNSNIMYDAAGDTLWRNGNLSQIPDTSQSPTPVNWRVMSNASASGEAVTAVSVSKVPANVLYFGTEHGKVFRVDSANTGDPAPVDISTNKGLPTNAFVSCLAVDPNNADNVMLVYSNYEVISLFYTTDAGNTWTDVAGNLEQYQNGSGDGPSCRWATILNYGGTTTYYVATSTGLYSTTQLNGTSTIWVQEGENSIGNIVCDMVVSRETDGKVVVATHGNGIYTNAPPNNSGSYLLGYDGYYPPVDSIYFYANNYGDVVGNILTAPNSSVKIDKLVYYIFGDHSTGDAAFYPVIYLTGSGTNNYGEPADTPFYVGPLDTPSIGWNTIDLSSQNIIIPVNSGNNFLVGVEYDGTDEPKVGYHIPSNGRGWFYLNSNWVAMDDYTPAYPATLCIRAYVSDQTGTFVIDSHVPDKFTLSQNFPNPFNPSTTIEYDLPRGENVRLKIYDVLGRQVATLVNAYQSPGNYRVEWNGKNGRGDVLASGVYFYSFEAGNFRVVKKMLYLK